jgi:serine/threonine protein kinase
MEPELLVCPDKIGPYQLRGTIGAGGFSTVKLAYRADRDMFYACKIVRRKRLKSEHELKAFESEIRILQQIRHPHLLGLCDLFRDRLNYYVLIEFCPNGDLFRLICKCRRIPEDSARVFFKEILLGLEYLHALDFAHRDIKPENVLIDDCGHARLTDFGLAKHAPPDALTSTPCGSPCYVAPEILKGVPYCPQLSDMWSLGVVLYAMVTGRVPWRSTNRVQIFEQISAGDIEIPLDISKECADLMMKCLKLKPSDRVTATEALAHPWLVPCPPGEPRKCPLPSVSLRRVDNFFSPDDEDENFAAFARANSSTSALTQTFPKVLAAITTVTPVDARRAKMQKQTVCQSMMMPMGIVDQLPAFEIEALMQELVLTQKKKPPRLIRPRLKPSQTDGRLPTLLL